MSKVFIILGIAFLVVGIVMYLYPSIFSWFGKLPGDIRLQGKAGSVYFPIVSGIVISIILTVLLNLFLRR